MMPAAPPPHEHPESPVSESPTELESPVSESPAIESKRVEIRAVLARLRVPKTDSRMFRLRQRKRRRDKDTG